MRYRNSLLGVIAGAIFLGSWFFIWQADVWRSHFYDSGTLLFGYQIFRVLFFFGLIVWPLALGRWLAPRFFNYNPPPGSGSSLVHLFFLGAAALSIFGSVLAHAQILRIAVVLPLALILTVFSPQLLSEDFRQWQIRIRKARGSALFAVAILLVFVQLVFLLLTKALPPDRFTVDSLGHYLPYVQSVLDAGGLQWPTPYYINFFFLKGSGLVFLATALTDVNGFQLISFAFFCVSAAIVAKWSLLLFRGAPLLAVAITSLYLTEPSILAGEFQKTHMMSGAILLYLIFALGGGIPLRVLLFITGAFAFMNPTYQIFTGLLLLSSLFYFLLSRNFTQAMTVVKAGFICVAVVLLTLLTNFIWTGVAELTPFKAALELSDPARRPPGILMLHVRYLLMDEGAQTGTLFLYSLSQQIQAVWSFLWHEMLVWPGLRTSALLPSLAGLVALIVCLGTTLRKEKSMRLELSVASCVLAAVFLIKSIVTQGSFSRGITFVPALRLLVLLTFAFVVFETLRAMKNKQNLKFVATTLAGMLFALTIWRTQDSVRNGTLSLQMFSGEQSFGSYYNIRWDNPCTQAREKVPEDSRIMPLHFLFSCVGNPTARIDYIDPQNYLDGDQPIYLQEAGAARAALEKLGIRYFLFVPGLPMYFFSGMPVFQPSFVATNFKIAAQLKSGYLLTWRYPSEPPLAPEFVTFYEKSTSHPDDVLPKQFLNDWAKRRLQGER
jgi:hypothetical protein